MGGVQWARVAVHPDAGDASAAKVAIDVPVGSACPGWLRVGEADASEAWLGKAYIGEAYIGEACLADVDECRPGRSREVGRLPTGAGSPAEAERLRCRLSIGLGQHRRCRSVVSTGLGPASVGGWPGELSRG